MTRAVSTTLELLAAGREARASRRSPTRAIEVDRLSMIAGARVTARVTFIARDRDDGGRLDAAAGCEFVDDRIRLME